MLPPVISILKRTRGYGPPYPGREASLRGEPSLVVRRPQGTGLEPALCLRSPLPLPLPLHFTHTLPRVHWPYCPGERTRPVPRVRCFSGKVTWTLLSPISHVQRRETSDTWHVGLYKYIACYLNASVSEEPREINGMFIIIPPPSISFKSLSVLKGRGNLKDFH